MCFRFTFLPYTVVGLMGMHQPEIVLRPFTRYPKQPFQTLIPRATPQGEQSRLVEECDECVCRLLTVVLAWPVML